MKSFASFVVFLASTLGSPLAASAEELALGGGVAAGAAQVQVDVEFERRAGLQLGVGEVLDHDSLAVSVGGRVYFLREVVTPYVGVLFSHWEGHGHHHGVWYEEHDLQHFGPSIGVRIRDRGSRGLGAFVEIELLTHLDEEDDDFHPALGAGVQWWF